MIAFMDEEYRFVEPSSTTWTLLHTGKEKDGILMIQHGIKSYFFFQRNENGNDMDRQEQETWISNIPRHMNHEVSVNT